jgi:hypothetical protein
MSTTGSPSWRWDSLAVRLMLAQVLVITAGAVTLLVTAFLVAPGLFSDHLAHAGVSDPEALGHAEAAFTVAFGIALPVGALMSLTAAGLVSWVLVRRLARPIEQLAASADVIAAGGRDVPVLAPRSARRCVPWPTRSSTWRSVWPTWTPAVPACWPTWPTSCAPR